MANVNNNSGSFEYFLDLEFRTLKSLPFGVIVIIDPSANGNLNDSSLSISVFTSPFYRLPTLGLKHMTFTSIDSDTIDQDAITTATSGVGGLPALTGVGVGVTIIGTGAIAAYFIKSRRLSAGGLRRRFNRDEN